MIGLEYTLAYKHEPELFIIQLQRRSSPTNGNIIKTDPLSLLSLLLLLPYIFKCKMNFVWSLISLIIYLYFFYFFYYCFFFFFTH